MSCKKVSYSSRKFADADLKRIFNTSTRTKIPIRSYECSKCKTWHLTSLESFKQNKFEKLIFKIKDLETEIKNLKSEKTVQISKDETFKKMQQTITNKDKKIKNQQQIINDLVTKLNAK